MPWGVAAAVVGGVLNKSAADSAADAQSAAADKASAASERAADKADATQRYFYDTNRADNSSFLGNGRSANNRLAMLMGLTPSGGYGGNASAPNQLTADAIRKELLPNFTKSGTQPSQAYQQVSDDPFSSIFHPNASSNVGMMMVDGPSAIDETGLKTAIDARMAQQAQEQNQFQISSQQQSLAAQQAAQSDPDFGKLTRNFTMADRDADPVYQSGLQFGLDQGVQGINRLASANGGADNGAILKALARFGNDYGTTKAGGAYDRFNNNNTTLYNRLAGLSGTGQTASGQIGAAGMNAGNQIANTQMNLGNSLAQNAIGVGNARAASMIGGGNALSGGLANAYNGYQQTKLMDRFFPQNSGSGYSSPDTNYSGNSWDSGGMGGGMSTGGGGF